MEDLYIDDIRAREILDSRGNPTVEVEITLEEGSIGRAAVPSGASTGEHEALEMRDGDAQRFNGKGVRKAIANIQDKIAPELLGHSVLCQRENDGLMLELDGTENKGNLGANAILGVSLAMARAAATALDLPLYRYLGGANCSILPVPMMNIINGGSHADNNVDIQEFMILPTGFDTFSEALRAGVETFHALKKILQEKGLGTAVGDEGGFAPDLKSNQDAFDVIMAAIEKAGYKPGDNIFLGVDAAASEFYESEKGVYNMKAEKQQTKNSDEMIEYYKDLCSRYPIISIEDGLDQNDWDAWKKLTESLAGRIQIVGDDLLVTNVKKLQKAIDTDAVNSILIKVNQIGSLSETLDAIMMAQKAGYTAVVSHRSGETEDVSISHIAVGAGTEQIKTGSVSRTERTAKYNELLRIEEELGAAAQYPGKKALYCLR